MGISLRVGTLLVSGLLTGALRGQAQQCPATACVPGAASLGSTTLAANAKMGIYNVTLGSISNPSGNYTEGYKDYSCTQQATLAVSAPATITITNGTVVNENVRVWIDYDNNGTFSDAELAFSSNAAKKHSGTITPPATAVLGTALRLRVASDYSSSAIPGPCTTPDYSQDEDYAVVLTSNSQPPVAAFTEDVTTTCTGTVQFTDKSVNAPTSWQWYFGDGSTSTDQNPSHQYTTAGTYSVQLTATNAAGNSTSAATSITYNPSVPVAAACPGLAAVSYCCGYGILRVRLGSIDNTSTDGSAGYQDFTCPKRTSFTVGDKATLQVTTSTSLQHNTRAWLDVNNDGAFSDDEKLVDVSSTISPSATFTVPGTAVLNQPLRFRIVADALPNVPSACTAPQQGQVEDYTVTVLPNTKAPTAAFTSTYVAGSCAAPTNTYTFTDASTDGPTSWLWSFSPSTGITYVNGTSATSQNPQVNFGTAGTYSVTLTATNANGSSTVTKASYLTVNVPCVSYCASNGGGNAGGPGGGGASQFWITKVEMTAPAGGTAFSNSSDNTTSGYTFYSSPAIVVQGGATQTLAVTVNRGFIHRVSVWIDYDRSGTFENATELVYSALSQQNVTRTEIPLTLPANVSTTRMRIQALLNNNTPNACATNLGQAEVEDYTITPLVLAVRESQALPGLSVSPVPSPDGRLRVTLADASATGRYTVQVCSVLGATLRQLELHLGSSAADLDLSELPAGLYLLRFTDAQGHTGLRRVVRQ